MSAKEFCLSLNQYVQELRREYVLGTCCEMIANDPETVFVGVAKIGKEWLPVVWYEDPDTSPTPFDELPADEVLEYADEAKTLIEKAVRGIQAELESKLETAAMA